MKRCSVSCRFLDSAVLAKIVVGQGAHCFGRFVWDVVWQVTDSAGKIRGLWPRIFHEDWDADSACAVLFSGSGVRFCCVVAEEGVVSEWWQTFFDQDYLRVWGQMFSEETNRQAGVRPVGHAASWMRRVAGAGSSVVLRYLRHDLRTPLSETGFDVACNIFTSFGYGTEEEDVAIFERCGRPCDRAGA
jgi:hypothetical protein